MGVSTTVFLILERIRPDRELPQPTIQRVFSAIRDPAAVLGLA
jgi:hypothetical protein